MKISKDLIKRTGLHFDCDPDVYFRKLPTSDTSIEVMEVICLKDFKRKCKGFELWFVDSSSKPITSEVFKFLSRIPCDTLMRYSDGKAPIFESFLNKIHNEFASLIMHNNRKNFNVQELNLKCYGSYYFLNSKTYMFYADFLTCFLDGFSDKLVFVFSSPCFEVYDRNDRVCQYIF